MNIVQEYGIRVFTDSDRIGLYKEKLDTNSEEYLYRVATAIPVKQQVCERLRQIPRHRSLVPIAA